VAEAKGGVCPTRSHLRKGSSKSVSYLLNQHWSNKLTLPCLPSSLSTKCVILSIVCCPIAFARVVFYARCMELLTHDELARLTPPERLALISQLWDSLEDDQLPLTAAQRVELDSRLATLDQDRREGITWATLKAELESRS